MEEKGYPTGLQKWNPAGYIGQSMEVKEAGAEAYAKVLQSFGLNATSDSRGD